MVQVVGREKNVLIECVFQNNPAGDVACVVMELLNHVKTCLGITVCTGCPSGWDRVNVGKSIWGDTALDDFVCIKK